MRTTTELSPERQAQMRELTSKHLWTTSFRTVLVSDPFEPERVVELFQPRNELPVGWTPEELRHRGIRQGDAFYLVKLAPMYAAIWTGRHLQVQGYDPVRPSDVDKYTV